MARGKLARPFGARFGGQRKQDEGTWERVACDWRGSKLFYRERWESGVEWILGALSDEGGCEELALEYWKTHRLFPPWLNNTKHTRGKRKAPLVVRTSGAGV